MTTEDSGLQEAAVPHEGTRPLPVFHEDSPSPAAVTGEWTVKYDGQDYRIMAGETFIGFTDDQVQAYNISDIHNLAITQLTARAEKAKEEIESWRFFHRKAIERAEAAKAKALEEKDAG